MARRLLLASISWWLCWCWPLFSSTCFFSWISSWLPNKMLLTTLWWDEDRLLFVKPAFFSWSTSWTLSQITQGTFPWQPLPNNSFNSATTYRLIYWISTSKITQSSTINWITEMCALWSTNTGTIEYSMRPLTRLNVILYCQVFWRKVLRPVSSVFSRKSELLWVSILVLCRELCRYRRLLRVSR